MPSRMSRVPLFFARSSGVQAGVCARAITAWGDSVLATFRMQWIYRPGADLFVVYNESWDAPNFDDLRGRDRQIIVKFTYPLRY